MKSSAVCIAILLTICVSSSLGAAMTGIFKDPNNPGKCTIKPNLVLSPGEKVKDPDQACGQIECQNDQGLASVFSCGLQGVRESCRLGDYINRSLPYPDCCPKYVICK